MAFPEKVIERLEREPVKTPGWSGSLLVFSFGLFVMASVVYLGIRFGYETFLQKQIDSLDAKIKQFSAQMPEEKQQRLALFYSQLTNIQSVTNNHPFVSSVFAWLEGNTVQSVYFNKFSLNTASNQLSLTGFGKTLNDASAQIKAFQESDKVTKVTVNNVVVGTGGYWQFDVVLTFNPSLFKTAPQSFGL